MIVTVSLAQGRSFEDEDAIRRVWRQDQVVFEGDAVAARHPALRQLVLQIDHGVEVFTGRKLTLLRLALFSEDARLVRSEDRAARVVDGTQAIAALLLRCRIGDIAEVGYSRVIRARVVRTDQEGRAIHGMVAGG